VSSITSNGIGGGNWSDPASWAGGVVPGEGDTVQIVSGDTITIDTDITVGDDTSTPALDILNGGTLDWDNAGDDTLILKGDFYARSGGTLTLNGAANVGNVLTLKGNYSASPALNKYKFIFSNGSTIDIDGYNKTRNYDTVASKTSDTVFNTTNNNDTGGWQVGDTLVIVDANGQNSTTDTIAAISGTEITLTTGTSYVEVGSYVANLTNNIVIEAYEPNYGLYISAATTNYGDMTFDWVEFKNLGNSTGSGSYGIYVRETIIRNCSFRRTSTVGFNNTIRFNDSGTDNFLIDNNVTYNCFKRYGGDIFVRAADNGTVSNNLCIKSSCAYFGVIDLDFSASNVTVDGNIILDSDGYGIGISQTGGNKITISNNIIKGCSSGGIYLEAAYKITLENNDVSYCSKGIVLKGVAGESWDNGSSYANDTDADVYFNGFADIFFDNCSFSSTTPLSQTANAVAGSQLRLENCSGIIASGHKTYKKYGSYEKQSTVKYSGDYALLMSPNDADNELVAEATVFAKAGETVAYSCYMRKDVSMAVLPYVRLSGAGITADTATMTDSVDTWELLTVSGIAGEDGFCKIEFVCQNASGSVYVDDDQDSFAHWFEGDIPSVVPKPSMTANDIMNTSLASVSWSPGTFGALVKNINQFVQILAGWIVGR